MRIGIALFQFFPGRIGGAGDYIERLVPGLLDALVPDDELVLLGNAENLGPFESLVDSRLERVVVDWSRRWVQILRFADLVIPCSPSRLSAVKFNDLQLDVLLCPQQSIFPRGIRAPTVVTVVDLLHYRCPQLVSLWQRWLRKRKESHVVHNCVHTISISQSTRSDLIEFYPISPAKCSVVYLGGKPQSVKIAANPVPPGESYVYYPANAYPHKNHLRLLQAFAEYRAAEPNRCVRLVLSGQCSRQLKRVIETRYQHRGVLHLGYISREEVAAVYAGCRAVIIPSLFEGFGMPLVEGLGYKRPVFCSNLEVFRELAGDAVEYFDPTSIAGMKDVFVDIFQSDPRLPNSERVLEILDRLNWDRCAKETYAILQQCARGQMHAENSA